MAVLAVASWLISAGWIVAWLATGAHFATQYQVAIEETVEDEFGDAVTRTRMEDGFRLGLLPDRPWDGAGTNGFVFLVLGGVAWWARRRRPSARQTPPPDSSASTGPASGPLPPPEAGA